MLELKKPLALAQPSSLSHAQRPELESERRVPLRDYWGAIRKRLWLVSGLTILITAIAAIYLVRKPNIYEAQALVLVDLEDLNPVQGAASKNPVIVNGANNDPAYFNTQLRILTSQGLLRRVVKTLDIEHNASFPRPSSMPEREKWWANLQQMFGGGSREKSKAVTKEATVEKLPLITDDASPGTQIDVAEARRLAPFIKDISDDLRVEPVVERRLGYSKDNTRLIEIQYQHHEPEIAAKIVNTMADTFVLLNLERRAETNVTTGDFLQKRIAELQSQIRSSEERLINYARSNQILSLNADQNTVVERLTGLNKQLLEAENRRKVAEANYRAALAPGAASALAEESSSRKIIDIETRLAEFRQKRAQLLVENTEEWPEVKEVNQQIASLEEEIRNARNRSTTVLLTNQETQYRQALAAEQALRKDFDRQRGETLSQNEAAINYRIIQQEIETNKNLLDGLLQRYKENDVVMAGMRKNIHVIDYALAADKPIGPRRWQGIILVFCFSLALSVGLAMFMEYLNDTITSSEDAEKMLRVPVLVTIPAVSQLREQQFEPGKLFALDSHSALAESYRQLRTSILFANPGQTPKTLLVTSSRPGEGKTTTAVNLAYCLAQIGANVLIIDADLRRPRLHSIFGMPRHQGLSTCLSKGASEAQILAMIRQYKDTRLHLLSAGPVPPNPAELLGSEQMRRLLTTLQSHFTHIIIDSPPTASFTDAVLLSSMADGIIMVVQSGKTQYKTARYSLNLMAGAGAKVYGTVLNQTDHRRQEDSYYQEYYQQPEQEQEDDSRIIDAEIVESAHAIDGNSNGTAGKSNSSLPKTSLHVRGVSADQVVTENTEDEEARFHALCADFDNPVQSVRENAIYALGRLGANHTSAIARALREAPFVRGRRIGAAIASSGLADEAIGQLTNTDEKYYDALSLLLLMMKAGEAQPLLRAVKEHPNNNVRIAVISLLALSRQEEILSELHRMAFPLPPEVRSALLTALNLPRNA
jgi:polysaccharide biosynthesis transport protein